MLKNLINLNTKNLYKSLKVWVKIYSILKFKMKMIIIVKLRNKLIIITLNKYSNICNNLI